MRKFFILATVLAFAGCGGGGGGGTTPNPNPNPTATTTVQGDLVTPQFIIVIPGRTGSTATRKPNFVSTATKSVTITLVSVNGNPPTTSPTSVTTNLDNSGGACNTGCPVNGPPSPPGQADVFSITTYDGLGGAGGNNALDTATTPPVTPTAGQNTTIPVTLKGIPFSITIGALTSQTVDSANTQSVTVTVKDHAGQTITGTYANVVRITDPDPATYGASVKGTTVTGTHNGTGCTTTCVDVQTNTDTVTLNYTGLAEDPVTLTSSATGVTGGNAGSATFSPTLHAINHTSGGNSTLSGTPVGIDLYTNDSTCLTPTCLGYTGTEGYHEDGYTDSPYNKVLATIDGSSCTAFANIGAANASNDTVFTATTTPAAPSAPPSAGTCTRVVSDGLAAANHGTAGPQFVVTYTTSSVNASSKKRQQR